jgi:outer membrane protein assembly factor BamB
MRGHSLTAYDAVTGEKLWTFGAGNMSWAPQPVASADGIVFYLEGSNLLYELYAVDADQGTLRWQAPIAFDLGFSNTNLVTVDEEKGLVYLIEEPFAPDQGRLIALDKATGAGVWFKGAATDNLLFRGDYPVLGGGKIFAGSAKADDYWNWSPVAIETTGQTIAQTYTSAGGGDRPAISRAALCGDTLLSVFVDRADSAESVGTVVAFDVLSQAVLWQKAYDARVGGLACNPAQNRVYIATDLFLFAFDAATGDEIWKFSSFGEVYNPSVANGVVYFLSSTNMYAVDEATGQQLFFFRLGEEAEPTSQVAINSGMVYFSGNGGTCDLLRWVCPKKGPRWGSRAGIRMGLRSKTQK